MEDLERIFIYNAEAVIVGMCIGLFVVMGMVVFGLYWAFRQKSLIYFGFAVMTMYAGNAFIPANVILGTTEIPSLRLVNLFVIVFLYWWYRVVKAIAEEKNFSAHLIDLFRLLLIVSVIGRMQMVLFPTETLARANAWLGLPFHGLVIVMTSFAPKQTLGERIHYSGIGLISAFLLFFSITRTTTISWLNMFYSVLPVLVLFGTTLSSVVALLGIIVRAKEERASEQLTNLEETAKSYLEMRDRMNTPLQTLECATELLREVHSNETNAVLPAVSHALERLRTINDELMDHENRMPPHARV